MRQAPEAMTTPVADGSSRAGAQRGMLTADFVRINRLKTNKPGQDNTRILVINAKLYAISMLLKLVHAPDLPTT